MTEKKEPTFETVHDVLHHIQQQIVAPKGQQNKFGGYKYRSCEDIVEAAKRVMPEGATLVLLDDILAVPVSEESREETKDGKEKKEYKSDARIYIKATAVLSWGGQDVRSVAMAREEFHKKGMDASQLTGATSSYARKYALNGLFMIDDTKDADATNQHGKTAEDQKTIDAVGGSVRDGVDTEQREQMYNQALKDIAGCDTEDALKKVVDKINKGIKIFSDEQRADIISAKDQQKIDIANKPPF